MNKIINNNKAKVPKTMTTKPPITLAKYKYIMTDALTKRSALSGQPMFF